MSSGMLLLAGLFATGPAAAEPEVAPMPRAKNARIAVEFRIDLSPRGIAFGAGVGPAKPLPAPPPNIDPQTVVRETRTGQFMVSGGVNSNCAIPPLPPALASQPAVGTAPGYRVFIHDAPPPEVHAMMMQTFCQMGATVPQPAPMPPTLCPPVIQAAARPGAAWTGPALPPMHTTELPEGTWTRTVGPVRYKLEVKAKTLTVTTTLSEEEDDGKVVDIDHVLTMDWYPTRNANEIVGLVTGFDIAMHDKTMSREDVTGLLASLATIQKQLNGKPVALTWRMNDGTLVVGDVRFPELKNEYEELSSALSALGGNYKTAATEALPAVSVVPASGRASQERRMQQLLYQSEDLRQIGQEWRRFWFNDQPGHHLTPERIHGGIGRTTNALPPMPPPPRVGDDGLERIGIDFNFNPPRRTGYPIALPPMPPPAPLPNPFRDGRFNR